MKVLLISAALIAIALSEAPAPPAGWRPSGRLLLLPARLEYSPPAENVPTTARPDTNSTQKAQGSESDESESSRLVDSGEYYVLLPDGRLQMVKYTTAALTAPSEAQQSSQNSEAQQSQDSEAQQPQYPVYQQPQYPVYQQPQNSEAQQSQNSEAQQPQYPVYQQPQRGGSDKAEQAQYPVFQQQKAEPAQFQVEYVQFPLPGSQFSQTKLQLSQPETKPEAKEQTSGFEANVQYRDVKPISAPIYAYNSAPLVRILKK